MSDLNDLHIFSQAVEHNGFTGAAKAMGIAPSSVCRRVGRLEQELGIRLVQRTTRRFAVTELGAEFHGYCVKMLAEAQAAYEMAARAKATPAGLIRVSCPPLIAQRLVSPLIARFVSRHPQVRIALLASEIQGEQKFDLCIRVRETAGKDSAMIVRPLGLLQHVLVASPHFLHRQGRPTSPSEAAQRPTLSHGLIQGPHTWRLMDLDRRQEIQVRHAPVLITDDLGTVQQAAIDGVGIARLPLAACTTQIEQKLLEIVLPRYPALPCEIQAMFPSRRGMLPAVRSFIDFLCAECGDLAGQPVSRRNGRASEESKSSTFTRSRRPIASLSVLGPAGDAREQSSHAAERARGSIEPSDVSRRIA